MDVEQRAREMNLAMTVDEVAKIISGAPFPSKQSLSKARAVVEFMENRAALTPPEGHVVVTRNEAGQAVAVTRQDNEGRILSVIAEFEPPEGYVLVPVEPTEAMLDKLYGQDLTGANDEELCAAYAELLAARLEVKP